MLHPKSDIRSIFDNTRNMREHVVAAAVTEAVSTAATIVASIIASAVDIAEKKKTVKKDEMDSLCDAYYKAYYNNGILKNIIYICNRIIYNHNNNNMPQMPNEIIRNLQEIANYNKEKSSISTLRDFIDKALLPNSSPNVNSYAILLFLVNRKK